MKCTMSLTQKILSKKLFNLGFTHTHIHMHTQTHTDPYTHTQMLKKKKIFVLIPNITGSCIIFCRDGTIREWDLVTMTSVRVLHGHKGPVRDIKVNKSFNI